MTKELNIYKEGVIQCVRFSTSKGLLTIEDLNVLPLTSKTNKVNLNSIYVDLQEQLEGNKTNGLVSTPNAADKLLELKAAIVKDIFETRRDEANKATEAKVKSSKLAKIRALREKKADDSLENMTEEELEALEKELMS